MRAADISAMQELKIRLYSTGAFGTGVCPDISTDAAVRLRSENQRKTLRAVAVVRRRQIRVRVGYSVAIVGNVRVYEHSIREHKVHE